MFGEKNGHVLLRCRRCLTLYTRDRTEMVYEAWYLERVAVADFVTQRLDRIVAKFEKFRRTGRLLDVGFGGGELLDAARRAGWQVHGVDVSAEAVDRARQRGIEATHGTLANASFDSASFDVVVAVESLEHIADLVPLLTEARRVLRPGGLLWITTPHGRGLSARILGTAWSVVSPPEHIQLFSIRGIRTLLRSCGFTRVSISAESLDVPGLLAAFRRRPITSSERIEGAYTVNAFFEDRLARRAAKNAANQILSLLRLGDSLKVSAVR